MPTTPIADAGADQLLAYTSGTTTATITAGTQQWAGTTGTYKWTIVGGPQSNTASLSSTTAANPTLNSIDQWGNYRLFLIITNGEGVGSESNPLKAPDSAFCTVRMKGETIGLQRPAPGERNWHYPSISDVNDKRNHAAIEALEALRKEFNNRTVFGISDVSAATSTGTNLDKLMDNSSATGLHKHAGADVDPATTAALGTAKLHVAPVSAAAPVVLNKAYGSFEMRPSGTVLGALAGANGHAGGWVDSVIGVMANDANESMLHASVYVPFDIKIEQFAVSLRHGGVASGGGLTVKLMFLTDGEYAANTLGAPQTASTLTIAAPASDGLPLRAVSPALTQEVGAGRYLGVYVTAVGATAIAGMPSDMTATVYWSKTY